MAQRHRPREEAEAVGGGALIRGVEKLKAHVTAIKAGLRAEELIALQLYTGERGREKEEGSKAVWGGDTRKGEARRRERR